MIDDVIEHVQNLRDNIDTEFQHWYDDVKLLADDVGGREEMPRITRVQRHRANVEAETPLLYYKRAIAIPFMDNLIQQLKDRFFAENCLPVIVILNLIPCLMLQSSTVPAREELTALEDYLPSPKSLGNE